MPIERIVPHEEWLQYYRNCILSFRGQGPIQFAYGSWGKAAELLGELDDEVRAAARQAAFDALSVTEIDRANWRQRQVRDNEEHFQLMSS